VVNKLFTIFHAAAQQKAKDRHLETEACHIKVENNPNTRQAQGRARAANMPP
jgi:hypothetical protein